MRHPLLLSLLFLVAALPATAGASREEYIERRGMKERLRLSLGANLVRFDTRVRFGSDGDDIVLEDDLNLDSRNVEVGFDGFWRFRRKHRFDFSYNAYSRGGSRTILERELELDGKTFLVGAEVRSDFDTEVLRVAYHYSFLNSGFNDFGISFGVSAVEFEGSLTGEVDIAGSFETRTEAYDFLAPVPALGLHYERTLKPRMFLRVTVQYFALEASSWEGRLRDSKLTWDWFPWKHFGFGAGLNFNKIRYLRDKDENKNLDIVHSFSGLIVYLSYFF